MVGRSGVVDAFFATVFFRRRATPTRRPGRYTVRENVRHRSLVRVYTFTRLYDVASCI